MNFGIVGFKRFFNQPEVENVECVNINVVVGCNFYGCFGEIRIK